jgi:hypothetical protein
MARAGLALLAGLSLGAAWLCKESVVYLAPMALGVAVWRLARHQDRAVAAGLVLGGALVLLPESLFYLAMTGDPLHRAHVVEKTYEDMARRYFTVGGALGFETGQMLRALLRRWLWDGPRSMFLNADFGYVPAAALLGLAWATWRRQARFVYPGLWMLSLACMYLFASSSLTSYRPLVLFDRYLYPLLFPAILVTAGFLAALIDPQPTASRGRRRLGAAKLGAGLALVCVQGVAGYAGRGRASPVERQVAARCGPQETLVTDSRTAGGLRRLWGFPGQDALVEFELDGTTPVPPPGALVLINRPMVEWLRRTYKARPPDFYDPVPADWTAVWTGHGGELYRVPGAVP